MQELDDQALLREYAERDSAPAFAEIVSRHVDKVYSCALRHTRNPHSAEEITQAVFVILAQKAGKLSRNVILAGWLYQTARLTAITFLRGEIRRARREQEALMQSFPNENETDAWPHIAPLLDDALAGLGEKDRHAVVLRFFDDKSLKDVGAALGSSEDAAKVRVARALEKLRKFFVKRGVALTAAAIAGAVSANSVQAAPATLAKTVTVAALTKGATAGGSTLTLIKGALKIMAWTKVKMAVMVGVGILIVGGGTTEVIHLIQQHRNEAWRTERFDKNIRAVLNAIPPLVEILPTKYPQSTGWAYAGGVVDKKLVGVNRPLKWILGDANMTDLLFDRLIWPLDLPTNHFDYLVNLPANSSQALARKIEDQFGLVEKIEIRETNVFLLKVVSGIAPRLKPHRGSPNTGYAWQMVNGSSLWEANDMTISNLCQFLEMYLATPVVDRTGLKGSFDIRLKLNMAQLPMEWKDRHLDDFQGPLQNQLGLELVPSREPVEMLVVEKVR